MSAITWAPDVARIGDIHLWQHNPKSLSRAAAQRLLDNWEELGQWQTLAIGPNGECYDGHQRVQALLAVHGPNYEVAVLRASRALTDAERRRLIIEGGFTAIGNADWDALAAWPADELRDWGFDDSLLRQWNDDAAHLALMLESEREELSDSGAEIDIQEQWMILIECDGELHQAELLQRFAEEGLTCRALIS